MGLLGKSQCLNQVNVQKVISPFKVQNEAVYRAISSDINNKARFAL